MVVGFGSTVLAKGGAGGILDGIGSYTQELGAALLDIDVDIRPVTFGVDAGNLIFDRRVTCLPNFAYGLGFSSFLGRSFPSSGDLCKNIDIFHATDHHIPRLKQTPVVATLMDAIPLAHPEWASQRLRRIKNLLWKHTTTWADRVVTISEYSKLDLIKFFDVPPDRIRVVPLGVDTRYFEKTDDQRTCEYLRSQAVSAKGFFLFIGTLQPRKNVDAILDAYCLLPEDIASDIPLVIVGRMGWGCEQLVDRINSFTTIKNRRVIWLKAVSDIEKRMLLRSALALVFPSLYEGFGLPVLEAFASGLPVITSNSTALYEVAQGASLLVSPTCIEEIAQAMSKLVTNEPLRDELRELGLERAKQYTWENCARLTRDTYGELL
ncbi:glycosyltransferase family 4 protein [Paracandidimonas lactea]|uniref:glycosyltransferase family 4 protein n=1 Tax=Paracandidimonas lactea TaxID=2895524 RepID=UPI0021039069|nr:glycosyltransferase family 1 protein [Paracandidimonas lactea]